MTKDMKQYIIIGLLCVNFIGMYIIIDNKTDHLNDQITYLNNSMQSVRSEVASIGYSTSSELDKLKDDTLNKVNSFDYTYERFNKEAKTMDTGFIIELKENRLGGEVYLVAKDEEGKSQKVPLRLKDGLIYSAALELKSNHDYSVSIVEDFKGDLKQLNNEDYYVYLKSDFYSGRIDSYNNGYSLDENGITFTKQFDLDVVQKFDIEGFGIESLTMIVTKNGEQIYEEDALDSLIRLKDLTEQELVSLYNGELISGSDHSVYNDVYGTNESEGYVFQKVMLYEDYSEYNLKESQNIECHLIIILSDGGEIEVW